MKHSDEIEGGNDTMKHNIFDNDKQTQEHIWWAWALKNSVAIACWTILAIYFNKWWIALFAALFLSNISIKNEKDDEDGK